MEPNNYFKRLSLNSLDRALEQLSSVESIAIPCLGKDEREILISIVDALPRRSAKPITGPQKNPVRQDFDLCYNVPPENPTWTMAKRLEELIKVGMRNTGLNGHEVFKFNDLIVQYYPPQSKGITPHRDNVRYRLIIAILILSGDGNFCICENRDGEGARIIPAETGDLLLMAGSELARETLGPLHFLRDVTQERRTIGLRYDAARAASHLVR